MRDWFRWKNQRCTALGIIATQLPEHIIPAVRQEFKDVPGRTGSIVQKQGTGNKEVYDDITLTVQCFVPDEHNLTDIDAYLHGSGPIEFANRPGITYMATITNQIPFAKILRGRPQRSFPVVFRCSPYGYLEAADIEVQPGSSSIRNPGNTFSEPEITFYPGADYSDSNSTCTLTVNGTEMAVTFPTASSVLRVETETGHAYMIDNSGRRADGYISCDEFPCFLPGTNQVSLTGCVSRAVLNPRWRIV